MSLFEKKYNIKYSKGDTHYITAKKLYERIIKDSNSGYNLIAPASEIIRVCSQPDFPKEYTREIEIVILNYFSSLEGKINIETKNMTSEIDAINTCYNELVEFSEEGNNARQKYLKAVIDSIIKYHFKPFEFDHYGKTYYDICEKWKKTKFEENCNLPLLDFIKLRKDLHDEFDKTMKTAEKEGAFKKDDEEYIKNFRSSLPLVGI